MISLQQKRVLVTGATGLVGSHLVQRLVEMGVQVTALYRKEIPSYNGADRVEWVQADILDVVDMNTVTKNVQLVFHCAAIISFDPAEKKWMHAVNVDGTANVVNACIENGIEKLLHVSSVSALGRIRENEVITEKMQWSKETSNSEYGHTKFLAEMEVWRGIGEGLNAVMINPTIILGAADWTKGSAALFKNVYKEFPWYSDGVTGFVDVADVVKAMICLMESEIAGEKFIVSAENVTYEHLFSLIAGHFNKEQPRKKVTPFIASVVWRLEKIKSLFNGKRPLVTKETAHTALTKAYFDNSKLLTAIPEFKYAPLEKTVQRICDEFRKMYNLP